ncbi:MAG: FHA domain-containing protein, partial [Vicinamibacterales bacterium]|nr:FHA domain-containing protein [Vicinamibacterales bacterium]
MSASSPDPGPVAVDLDVLDQLAEANRQRIVLEEYLRRAEQQKNRVDEVVYRRVMEDYLSRSRALDTAADPLRTRARQEFDKLLAAYERLGESEERARLERDELEFRQQIGELDAAQLADRLRAPAKVLDDCRTALTRLDAQKVRFIEAFGSEEALFGFKTRRAVPADLASGSARVPRTFYPRAFVRLESEGEPVDYALGETARIGRSDDNDISVQGRGLSRQHALITADPQGFVLRDLGSQNGSVVNGERVDQRRLAHGDRISLGETTFTFIVAAEATKKP